MQKGGVQTEESAVHIFPLLSMANSMGRLIFKGLLDYAIEHPECRGWRFHPSLNHLDIEYATLEKFSPHAVISQVAEASFLEMLDGHKVPRVNVSSSIEDLEGPSVISDNFETGKLAAAHFISRRFRHYAFLGIKGAYYSEERYRGFVSGLEPEAVSVDLHRADVVTDTVYLDNLMSKEIEEWLIKLPKPIGLFASTDGLARQTVEFCEQHGIRCPFEVAVLGVDNDELECAISPVKLSSISLPFQSIGRKAAEIVHRQLKEGVEALKVGQLVLPPIGIVTRRSTELLAVDDPVVRKALEWIRKCSTRDMNVDELAEVCNVSRRFLERRFRASLSCSPNDEIVRIRLQQVQFMLAETNLTVTDIAFRLGYKEPKYLHRVFKQFFRCSPLEYRKSFRQ